MPPTRRYFTPRTARETLDRLRPAAERMCRLYRRLEGLKPGRVRPEQRVDPVYFALLRRLYRELETLRAAGAEVRDVASGRLVFPSIRGGRRVGLAWKVGEEAPDHDHWEER